MSWKNTMKSFRFVIKHPVTGKNWSFTDHLSISDKSVSWYLTDRMKKMFEWKDTGKVVRISQDVSGLGRRFKMVYSESKGWVGEDLTKINFSLLLLENLWNINLQNFLKFQLVYLFIMVKNFSNSQLKVLLIKITQILNI